MSRAPSSVARLNLEPLVAAVADHHDVEIRATNLTSIRMSVRLVQTALRTLVSIRQLRRADVAVSMSTSDGLVLAVAQRVGIAKDIPHVWVDVGAAQFLDTHRMLTRAARWAFGSASRVVVFSEPTLRYWRDVMRLGERAVLVRLGVDASGFTPQDPSRPAVISVGQVGRDYETFMEAVRLANVQGVVVHGSRAPMARATDQPPPPSTNVTILVDVPREQTIDLISSCAVVALPLRDVGFNSGQTVLLEAMALAKAIVATRTTGVEGYLEHGVNALLVAPRDAGGMADAFRTLLADDALRQRLGHRARVEAETRLSLARMQAEFCGLVERVAASE
jgi:glycosyltransferase involved in cell wall biosynthesis